MKAKKNSEKNSKTNRGSDNKADKWRNIVSAFGHSFSSGWVQNLGVAVLGITVLILLRIFGVTDMKATIISAGVLCTLLVWIVVLGALKTIGPQETEYSGFLLPDNRATPDNPCPNIPENALVILLGNSAAFSSMSPHNVLRIRGENVLTMERNGGRVAINAKMFSADGRIVAEIRQNEFSINPNNYFRKERPNSHMLRVFDQQNRKVLDVDFINPKAIRFSGIFNHPIKPVVISDTDGFFKNTTCFGNNATDVAID